MGLSPMMTQYNITKEDYKDCLLFYRLGDFYELFYEDAETASKALDLVLTSKNCGDGNKAPMCGVPYHAAESYISKLISQGYKVAICEQLENPTKGKIVKRDVVRIVTPGTVMESSILDETKNNYIASVCLLDNTIGIAYADITTGEFAVTEYKENIYTKCNDFLSQLKPSEIICNAQMHDKASMIASSKYGYIPSFYSYFNWAYEYNTALETIKKQLNTNSIARYDYSDCYKAVSAAGALITYLNDTQKRTLQHINKIRLVQDNDFLYLDNTTLRNLEIVETLREQKKKGSLLGVIDKTKTSMGSRMLRSWLTRPLQNTTEINRRHDSIESLINNPIALDEIMLSMERIYDIERLTGKISYDSIMPKDCLGLSSSLAILPSIKMNLSSLGERFNKYLDNIDSLSQISNFISSCIVDNPPAIVSGGGFIKDGFNAELDEYRHAKDLAKTWLNNLEAEEKEKTGIKGLKVGYTRIFGYYIEVPVNQQELVPYRYQRRQTISNHERYITPELQEIEDKILNAEDMAIKLEQKLYAEIKDQLKARIDELQLASHDIAELDCLCSLAYVSSKNNYVRPVINSQLDSIKIIDGRHPVVENILKNDIFVPNDTILTPVDNTMIITGPNMAGKSTYMRQVALITILAHMGCFVPAREAEICLVDRIFTRIGASDDLSYGQSTFMVEMTEVSNIINNATSKSLLLLDEVGRGTSTYDGLSIAWAVIEYIVKNIKSKTLFATHYHELTQLEGELQGVKNYRIKVKEYDNSIIFLRKIVRGGASKSFGIEVASLAGIYKDIIDRARNILHNIEESSLETVRRTEEKADSKYPYEIMNRLKDLDINSISPMVAFEILADLSTKAKKE